MTMRLADFGQNPQAMSDAPRFMVSPEDDTVAVETHTPAAVVEGLSALGHAVNVAPTGHPQFGAAQLVMKMEDGYLAASDSRRDGQAVGYSVPLTASACGAGSSSCRGSSCGRRWTGPGRTP